jgi:hypothetical protein
VTLPHALNFETEMDPKLADILIWSIAGSTLGTLWRAMTRPESSPLRWFIQVFVSLSVGILVGGAIIQHFGLHGYVAAGVGAVCAFLSEEVLRFFQSRGKKLENGKVDLTMGDD